jgi:tetratricopeptide (TPR) repeat protein
MRKILIILTVFLLHLAVASAQTKVQADEAYSQQEYEQAIDLYAQLVERGAGADVYYNMGNAYYRLDSMARAILCYERALRLRPGDDDVSFNLQLARSKTVDRLAPEREMFFVTWYRSLVNFFSVDAWTLISIVGLAAALVLLLCYFFADSERLRRVSFFSSLALVVLFVLSTLFAWQQKTSLASRSDAIVMVPSVVVRNIPSDSGTDQFTLHAGTKVTVTDASMADWMQVHLPDGRQGWVDARALEVI